METEIKQTAVEWLVSQILVKFDTYINEEGDKVDKPINRFFNAHQDSVDLIKYVNQAKEMEKEQIIDALRFPITLLDMSSEEYYNQTFKNK
jgi:hypothetical protein